MTQSTQLSPSRVELLDELLRKKGIAVQAAKTIRRVAKREFYPLSFAQERLWFIEQLEPDTPRYNVASVTRLQFPVSVPTLQRAFNHIITRHEVLRATFSVEAGQPVQRIADNFDLPVRVMDLCGLTPETREAEVQLLIDDEARRPFDLAHGPLLRVQLLRLSEADHVLLLTMHHIISDGWSMAICFDELSKLYTAELKGEDAKLPGLSVQYTDYAAWQREWLQGEVLERELSYWREQLRGAPSVLELPADSPRPAVQSYRGESQRLVLEPELVDELRKLSRETGTTLFMTLLAGFELLLWRYSGQMEIVVGTPVANRTRAEIEGLIGFFVNTLVLRVKIEPEWNFCELLARVKEVCLGAYAHQEVPFERVVEELQPQRSLSHSPLFQVMFVLQNQTAGEEESSTGNEQLAEPKAAAAKFDLTLAFTETGKQLRGRIEYKADLFTSETIRRMLRHFKQLLAEAVKNPDQQIAALPLLNEVEREQILRQWNATRVDYQSVCVHELFEIQAAATPEAIAVVCQDQQLTYAELNTRANQVAHHLISRGVGPETIVGIQMERSIEMIVALLATLKAGGAYLPLDPSYPRERVSFMIEDAGVKVLLTQTELREPLPAADHNPATRISADNLAYVIYTSGSTGTPKGVMITHQSVANLHAALAAGPYADMGRSDPLRVSLNAPLVFDSSVKQWVQLLSGHTLVLVPDAVRSEPAELVTYLEQQRVDVFDATPTQLAAISESGGWKGNYPGAVLVGGEAIRERQWLAWTSESGRDYYNVYGPTECTVDSTWCVISGDAGAIGKPMPNTQIYLLDERLEPVSVGIRGELYIGGDGIGRGYLHQPALTAERFLPDPFGSKRGARLYRTGDFARWRANGVLEYVGRRDEQVKIRGYRIELGEIERVLGQHPSVKECAVLASAGEDHLVAYVTGRETQPATSALRVYLRERLPQYMVPSSFVMLDQLPLTPTNKIDRLALASIKPDETNPSESDQYVAARDVVELKLTQIWEEVLGLKLIGVRDNFFELGGHSLLAVRLMALIQSQLNVTLPLSVLFRGGSIEELAKLLREQKQPEAPAPVVEIQPRGSGRPFFCVHPMGGNIFCYLELARHLGLDQPFYGIQPAGFNSTQIQATAKFYLEQLRAIQPDGPYLLGGWSFGGVVAFEMAQQLRDAGQDVSLLALIEASALLVRDRSVYRVQADLDNTWNLARLIWSLEGRKTPFSEADLQRVPEDERLHYILERAQTDRVIGVDFELAYLLDWAHGIKNSFKALADYEPQFYPGKVAVFEAEERANGDKSGWDELAREVDVQVVPGNHFTIVLEPHVRTLAQRLKACIDQVSHKGTKEDTKAQRKTQRHKEEIKGSLLCLCVFLCAFV